MHKHASRPFNSDIADAFFRAGMIESWGRGTERMFAECASAGVSAPALRGEPGGSWITFGYLLRVKNSDQTDPVTDPVPRLILALATSTRTFG